MNRRELLRELSRAQATWVNRNTPGSGELNPTAEQEQDYLGRISEVFDRAREDARRHGRGVTAARAEAAIELLLAFNPAQRRDRRGRWSKGAGVGLSLPSVPSYPGGERDRAARDDYNKRLLDYADETSAQLRDRGRHPDELDSLIEQARESVDWAEPAEIDEFVDIVRVLLKKDFDKDPGFTAPEALSAPHVPAGPGSSGGPRPSIHADYAQRADALDASIRSGVVAQHRLAQGDVGDTRRVSLADGTEAVYKESLGDVGRWTPRDQTDAETLAASVGGAIGAPVPAVQRVNPTSVYMELAPGDVGAVKVRQWRREVDDSELSDSNIPKELLRGDDALRLGLLDVLIDNPDRHSGNWLVDQGGRLYGIDHGLAFKRSGTDEPFTDSPFAEAFLTPGGSYLREGVPMAAGELAAIRGRIEALRPQFEELDRLDWYDRVLTRLGHVERGAK